MKQRLKRGPLRRYVNQQSLPSHVKAAALLLKSWFYNQDVVRQNHQAHRLKTMAVLWFQLYLLVKISLERKLEACVMSMSMSAGMWSEWDAKRSLSGGKIFFSQSRTFTLADLVWVWLWAKGNTRIYIITLNRVFCNWMLLWLVWRKLPWPAINCENLMSKNRALNKCHRRHLWPLLITLPGYCV